MFSSHVAKVVESFQNNTLELDPHPFYPISKISIIFPSFWLAHALEVLFTQSNTSKQYKFTCNPLESDRNKGILCIYANKSEAGEKVSAVFFKTFKKGICDFVETLPKSWVPHKFSSSPHIGSKIKKLEVAISKKESYGTSALYTYLNSEIASKVTFSTDTTLTDSGKVGVDIIAGSKEDVDLYFEKLKVICTSIQEEMSKE